MSDYICILEHLSNARKEVRKKDYISAAIDAFWAMQYCIHGEPYEMTQSELSSAAKDAKMIYRQASAEIEKSVLSKTTFVYGTICSKLLWLYKNKYNLRKISHTTQNKFDRGHLIGEMALNLFPDGLDATPEGTERVIDMTRVSLPFHLKQPLWIANTKRLLEQGYGAVYEAAFDFDKVFAAVDILVPHSDGYVAYEVKSSNAISNTLILDCALQHYVISKNVELKDFFLIYIDEAYVDELDIPLEEMTLENVDINRLFKKESVMHKILPLQEQISKEINRQKGILIGSEPNAERGVQCNTPYDCMFNNYCICGNRDYDCW